MVIRPVEFDFGAGEEIERGLFFVGKACLAHIADAAIGLAVELQAVDGLVRAGKISCTASFACRPSSPRIPRHYSPHQLDRSGRGTGESPAFQRVSIQWSLRAPNVEEVSTFLCVDQGEGTSRNYATTLNNSLSYWK